MQATDLLLGLLSSKTGQNTDVFSLKAEPQGNTSSLFRDTFDSAVRRTSRSDFAAARQNAHNETRQSEASAPKEEARETRDTSESRKAGVSEKESGRKRAETGQQDRAAETRKESKASEAAAADRKDAEAVNEKAEDGKAAEAAKFAEKQDEANRKLEALIEKLEDEAAKGDAADGELLAMIMQILALLLAGMEESGNGGLDDEKLAQLTLELDPDSELYQLLAMMLEGNKALDAEALEEVKVLLKLSDGKGLVIPLSELVKGDGETEGLKFTLEPASGDGESAKLNIALTAEDLKAAQLVNLEQLQMEKTDIVLTVPLEQLAAASGSGSIEALLANIENGNADESKLLKLLESLGLSKEELAKLTASQKEQQAQQAEQAKLRIAVPLKTEQGAIDAAKVKIQALTSDSMYLQSDQYMKSLEAEALAKEIAKGGAERRDLFERLQMLLSPRGSENGGIDSLAVKKVSATAFVQNWLQNFSDGAKQENGELGAKAFKAEVSAETFTVKGEAQQGSERISFLGREMHAQRTASQLFQSQSATPRFSTPGQNVHESVMNQIVQRISYNPLGSGGEIKVFLKPGNLGDVHIKIRTDQDTIIARITANSHEVKAIIESNLGQLKQSLEEQGVKVGQFDVTVDTGDSEQQAQNGAEDTAGDGYYPGYAEGTEAIDGEDGSGLEPGEAGLEYSGAEGYTYGRYGGQLNGDAQVSYLA